MNLMMKQRRRGRLSGQLGSIRSLSSQQPSAGPLVRSKNSCFSEEEEDLLIKLHTLLGNRWSIIAGRLPGRTAKEVQSYWNRHMRSKLKCTGLLDPEKNRDLHQWRRCPRNACRVGHPESDAKHSPSSNAKVEEEEGADDDCISDAGSSAC